MSQQINLLSPDLRQKRELVAADKLGVAALALALLVGGAVVLSANSARIKERHSQEQQARVLSAKEQLAALAKELAARKPNDKLALELAAAIGQLKGREEVMSYLERGGLGSTTGFAQFLRGFARQAPNGLWLTGFSLGEGGRDMEIHGRMLSPAALPDYINRLKSEAAFQGRSFASLDIHRAEADKAKPGVAATAPPKYIEFALSSSAPVLAVAKPAEVKP